MPLSHSILLTRQETESQNSPEVFLLHYSLTGWIRRILPKMAEPGGLLLLKKKPEDFFNPPAAGEDLEGIVPSARMKKGAMLGGDSPFSEAGT